MSTVATTDFDEKDFIDSAEIPNQGRKDVLLWESCELYVPDAEARKNWKDPSKCMVFWQNTFEPLSYRIKGGIYGSKEVQRVLLASNLTEEEAEEVRKFGYQAIPNERIARRSTDDSKPARSELDLLFRSARKAGLKIGFSKTNGQAICTGIGHVVETEEAEHTELSYKQKDGTMSRAPYVRTIVSVNDAYEAPPVDERKEYDRTPKGADGESVAATVNSGPTVDALRAGADASGLFGATTTDLGDSDAQIRFVNRARVKTAPVFAHPEVQAAAEKGLLVEYLIEKGVATVKDDVIIAQEGE